MGTDHCAGGADPQGFADLPYPRHKAGETALKARQAVQDGTVTALKRKDRPDRAVALVPGPETLPEMAARLGASTGPAESRQAELFHLLLEPRRDSTRQIVALTGQAADPAAAKASCRLWLEYFPRPPCACWARPNCRRRATTA
ncbi:MAG: hypothetical protein IPL38_16845 [Rhodobacter sp.]|nr:hypothetical protein [Rhodobacter sp.]